MRTRPVRYFPRRAISHFRTWRAWRAQGRPTEGPVVLRVGELGTTEDGGKSIRYWHWDARYVREPVIPDELYNYLGSRFPESVR